MKINNKRLQEIIKMVLLLLISILCGSSMLWLSVGQYSDLVYIGYMKNIDLFVLNI